MPNFTRAELLVLLDAVSQHIENHNDPEQATHAHSAMAKLEAVFAAPAAEPLSAQQKHLDRVWGVRARHSEETLRVEEELRSGTVYMSVLDD